MKTFLFLLLSFVTVTATLSGCIMIGDPFGEFMHLPLHILDGTPFKNFRDPGILLTAFVGGTGLIALFLNMQKHPYRYNWAIATGIMICGWIIVQMILIHLSLWIHFLYLGIGILIILTAFQLKWKWLV